MLEPPQYLVNPVGWVESLLTDPATAPNQGDEGAPAAWLVFHASMQPALAGLDAGAEVVVLTWLDRSERDTLVVHPRGDPNRPLTGVFSTRSPHRPNPIGLHRVRILEVDDLRVRVSDLEALDGTPIVDVKPVLGATDER